MRRSSAMAAAGVPGPSGTSVGGTSTRGAVTRSLPPAGRRMVGVSTGRNDLLRPCNGGATIANRGATSGSPTLGTVRATRERLGTFVPLSGAALVVAGVATVLALHGLAPEVAPTRRTLSQYALGPWKPAFDAGVLAVAAGSAVVLAGLLRAGLVP